MKKKLKSLLFALSFILTTGGCANEQEQDKSSKEGGITVSISLPELPIEDIQEVSEVKVPTEEELIEEIYQYLEHTKIPYSQDEYLLTDEEIDQLLDYTQSTTVCGWENDFDYYDFRYSGLIETILKNSQKYVRNHPKYVSGDKIVIDGINLQEEVYQILIDILVDINCDGSLNDIDEDICRLKDTSIVFTPIYFEDGITGDVVGEYVAEENVIIIYYQTLQKFLDDDNTLNDLLRETLEHEINHVRQYACPHRLENGQLYDILTYQDDCVCFLIESSAESELYAMNNDIDIYDYGFFYNWNKIPNSYLDYTYSSERSHEGMLLMLNLFQPGKTIQEYYEAIYDSDYKKFFEFFDVKNAEDAKELMDIIYNIDTLYDRTNFSEEYFGTYQPYGYEIRSAIGCNYTSRIFNKVLMNLINYTLENDDFTLEENLIMFNIVKGIITSAADYPKVIGAEQYTKEELSDHIRDLEIVSAYDEILVQYIYESENKYVQFLQLHYGVTEEEIRKLENEKVASVIRYIQHPFEYDELSKNIVISLKERFPLFTYVVFPNAYNIDDYNDFLEENHAVLIK